MYSTSPKSIPLETTSVASNIRPRDFSFSYGFMKEVMILLRFFGFN
jgi:hypothetical protein